MSKPNLTPEIGIAIGSERADSEFRGALSIALKGHDRKEIVGALRARGIPVTVSDLNEFTRSPNGGRGKRFPAAWLRDLCDALGEIGLREFALCEEQSLYLQIGAAFASNGWLRGKLLELLAGLDKAEARAISANRARAKSAKGKLGH
jgi:hypothetical protein